MPSETPENAGPNPGKLYQVTLTQPEGILRPILGEELEILHFDAMPFIKSNDHYGSSIFKVTLRLKRTAKSDEEELVVVAKMLPPSDLQRTMFDAFNTFKKEIFFYKELIPAYSELFEQAGGKSRLMIGPKYFGARLSLSTDDLEGKVDEDAVLMMENLKLTGYFMGERLKGLDKNFTKRALEEVAKFHGAGIAMRQKNPEFMRKLERYATPLQLSTGNLAAKGVMNFLERIKTDPELGPLFLKLAGAFMSATPANNYHREFDTKSAWSTCIHSDLWTNNILFQRAKGSDEIVDVKLVDFQIYFMASALRDVVFFLLTSTQIDMLTSNFEDLLEFYRKNLESVLEELGCEESGFVSKSGFLEQLKIDVPLEYPYVFSMLKVITLEEGENIYNPELNDQYYDRVKKLTLLLYKLQLL